MSMIINKITKRKYIDADRFGSVGNIDFYGYV